MSTRGNTAGGGYEAYGYDRASTAMAVDLEQGTQILEVCDSTLLQTDPIMGFPIPVSVLGRQMDVETILYLESGKGVTECLQGRSISRGCVVTGVLFGWPDT